MHGVVKSGLPLVKFSTYLPRERSTRFVIEGRENALIPSFLCRLTTRVYRKLGIVSDIPDILHPKLPKRCLNISTNPSNNLSRGIYHSPHRSETTIGNPIDSCEYIQSSGEHTPKLGLNILIS